MNELKLPKKDRPIGLYIYCNKHKRNYSHDKAVKCKCDADKYVYKANLYIPGSGNKYKPKTLLAKDLESALIEFREFKKGLENNSFQDIEINPKIEKPVLLIDCMDAFMTYIRNENVPFHEKIERDKKVVRSYKNTLGVMLIALRKNGIIPERMKFKDINSRIVGMVCEYLINEKNLRNKTFNNYMTSYKKFEKFIIDKFGYAQERYFKAVPKKKVVPIIRSVSMEEFNNMLSLVKYENGWITDKRKNKKGGVRKNLYRPWMINAFKLAVFTGARLEELVNLKWSDIRLTAKGEMTHLVTNHYKLNRAQSSKVSATEFMTKNIPIHLDLEDFLMELGYEENKNTDKFLIGPGEKICRTWLMQLMSRAFTHFFLLLNNGERKNIKHLRKTYITTIFIERGDETKTVTGHESNDILHRHYIDQDMVMLALREAFKKRGRLF